ncbi:MAG: iron-containing redox enzyme family protein [Acidimicrobiales bacterium]
MDLSEELRGVVGNRGGPSLSSYVLDSGTAREMRELAVHRSAYQLKEADPHTWAIPRLADEAKAAMVEIQSDEYGRGVPWAMHSTLFAVTMRSLGLDATYGLYLDAIPGPTLATCNLASMFGLHGRLRGALVGHLAAFEMTSVVPMARYSRALKRLGIGPEARQFYDVHVAANAHHEMVALQGLAGSLARQEPQLTGEILFGARALMDVEARFASHVLLAWQSGRSSLLTSGDLASTA